MSDSQGGAEDLHRRLPRLRLAVAPPEGRRDEPAGVCFCGMPVVVPRTFAVHAVHGDAFFIHQVAVDAYAAQHAGPASKPITVAFALIGLCLLLERGHTGKAVQRAHMRSPSRSKSWPSFDPPDYRGKLDRRRRAPCGTGHRAGYGPHAVGISCGRPGSDSSRSVQAHRPVRVKLRSQPRTSQLCCRRLAHCIRPEGADHSPSGRV